MKRKQIYTQISNDLTCEMYLRQLLSLAENVFEYKNIPKYIDTAYLNKTLLLDGSIAFFEDEVLGLLALPYTVLGSLDLYGRPKSIIARGQNGYNKQIDNRDDFIIMYDNNGRYPLINDIKQYAVRLRIGNKGN